MNDRIQERALETWAEIHIDDTDERCHAFIGLVGEAAEALDLYKKGVYLGKKVAAEEYLEELGDVLYYLAICASLFDINLEELSQMNYHKLKERHGDSFKTWEDQRR